MFMAQLPRYWSALIGYNFSSRQSNSLKLASHNVNYRVEPSISKHSMICGKWDAHWLRTQARLPHIKHRVAKNANAICVLLDHRNTLFAKDNRESYKSIQGDDCTINFIFIVSLFSPNFFPPILISWKWLINVLWLMILFFHEFFIKQIWRKCGVGTLFFVCLPILRKEICQGR